MPDPADELHDIERLPGTYGSIVAGIGRTNRLLALSGWSRTRRRTDAFRSAYTIRSADVGTRVLLQRVGQRVIFFFIRRPKTEDAILDMSVGFQLMPRVEDDLPSGDIVPPASVRLPRFLADPVSPDDRKVLAKALGENNQDKIVFLCVGLFRMGILDIEDPRFADVAWMLRATSTASLVYSRIPGDGPLSYRIDATPFLLLLDEVSVWARSGFTEGVDTPIAVESLQSPGPVQRVVTALLEGWRHASKSGLEVTPHDERGDNLPPAIDVRQYRGEVTLRLTKAGEIAEKLRDDDFRLRMTVTVETRHGLPISNVNVGPPDFLVDGSLHERLRTLLLDDKGTVDDLFKATGLDKQERAPFEAFLRAAASEALVFRAVKHGDTDTDFLAFQGGWKGQLRRVIVSAEYDVPHTTSPNIRLNQADLIFSDLREDQRALTVDLPQYLLRLFAQLTHWRSAFDV